MAAFLHQALWLAELLPRVERPLPRTIGLGFPFSLAGALGVLGGLARLDASQAERDRTTRVGGIAGFWVGTLLYAVALFNQIISS